MKGRKGKNSEKIIAATIAVAMFVFAGIACTKPETGSEEDEGHEHYYIISEIKEPTCTESGYEKSVCRCGDEMTTEKAPLGHKYGEYEYNNDGTCTKNGTETAKCERCGAVREREKENSKTEHEYGEYEYNNDGTCTKNGTETAKCKHCGVENTKEKENSKTAHDTEKHEGKEATCTENGWREYETCKNCEYSTYETIEAEGHEYNEMICSKCGAEDEENKIENLIIDDDDIVKGYNSSYVNHEITKIVIPEGVKGIAENAFAGFTEVTEIVLPTTLERIGDAAFAGCVNLSEIALPAGITEIGAMIFCNCEQEITIKYAGTRDRWDAIVKSEEWKFGPIITVVCKDDNENK